MEENLYFAYGSNLDLEQMAQRCPDAEIVGPVRLETTNCGSAAAASLPLHRKKAVLSTDWCGRSRQTANSLWIGMRGIPATTRKKP